MRTDKISGIILKYGGDYKHIYKLKESNFMFYNELTYPQWLESFNKITSSNFYNSTYILKTKNHNYYKIGRSHSVEKRMKSLQISCPFQLEVLCKVANSTLKEKYWLKHFKKYKTHGEWFKFDDRQVRELKYIIKKINICRYKIYIDEYKRRLRNKQELERYISDYSNHMRGE